VVWNSALYLSPIGVELLKEVVDIWLPDFKFGNDHCAKKIAGINNYTTVIKRNLRSLADQPSLVVRHMSYPGHEQCCETVVKQWIADNLSESRTHTLKYYPVH
jgi:putative pyruvate formate lyase activating enzyme